MTLMHADLEGKLAGFSLCGTLGCLFHLWKTNATSWVS